MTAGYCKQRSQGTRKGESSPPAMRQTNFGQTRVFSPRQLPTDHDHVGRHLCLIHEYQSDQPSLNAASTFAWNTLHRRNKENS